MLDHEGYWVFFERKKADGNRVLLPPKWVFVDGDGAVDFLATGGHNAEQWHQVDAKAGTWTFKILGSVDNRPIQFSRG